MTALRDYGERRTSDLLAQVTASGIGHFELHTPAMSLRVDGRAVPEADVVLPSEPRPRAVRSPRVGVLHWRVEQDGTRMSVVVGGAAVGEIDVAGEPVQIVVDRGGAIERHVDEGTFVEYGEIIATIIDGSR